MSDVVIRCPNCGTTQAALGECEACHESDARYFCPNHSPGRWIDGPACAACGARFTGRAHSTPAAPPPAARRPVPAPPPSVGRTPGLPRERPAPPVRRAPPPPEREPEVVDAEWVEREARVPWPPMRRPRRDSEDGPPGLPFPVVRIGVGSVFGCLGRLAVLAVAFVVVVLLWFFGYCGGPVGIAAGSDVDRPTPTRVEPSVS